MFFFVPMMCKGKGGLSRSSAMMMMVVCVCVCVLFFRGVCASQREARAMGFRGRVAHDDDAVVVVVVEEEEEEEEGEDSIFLSLSLFSLSRERF